MMIISIKYYLYNDDPDTFKEIRAYKSKSLPVHFTKITIYYYEENIIVWHIYLFDTKFKDYPAWKATFDGFIETRRASGEKSWQIFHPADDPNNLLLLFEWDSLANAHTFMANSELKKAITAAGVIEAPEVYFLERYNQGQV